MLTAPLHSSFVVAIRTNVQYLDMTILTSIVLLGHMTPLFRAQLKQHYFKKTATLLGIFLKPKWKFVGQ